MRSDDVAATIVDMTLMQQTDPETPSLGFATLCDAFQATVDANPDRVALRSLGGTESLTWSQYAQRVQRIAGGLAAMGTLAATSSR
jgi:acyl-CoA synthetase (AMP-forming)/AMP-acid ligase II